MENNIETDRQIGLGFKKYLYLGLLFILLIVVAAGIIYFQETTKPITESEKKVSDILNNPQKSFSQSVTITGNIKTILGQRAFTVNSPIFWERELLVINKEPSTPIGGDGENSLSKDDRVLASGVVREFRIREIEKELEEDLVDNVFANWEGKAVILAENVEIER